MDDSTARSFLNDCAIKLEDELYAVTPGVFGMLLEKLEPEGNRTDEYLDITLSDGWTTTLTTATVH